MKYLCKCSGTVNPYTYKGSGKTWLKHVAEHTSYIITCIIGEYETKEELKSSMWANLIPEAGSGGFIYSQKGKKLKMSEKGKANIKKAQQARAQREKLAGTSKLRAVKHKGINNYQVPGYIKTPWGIFECKKDAALAAQEIKKKDKNAHVLSNDGLATYFKDLDKPLNPKGCGRMIQSWRGKTPRELGFDIILKEDYERQTD